MAEKRKATSGTGATIHTICLPNVTLPLRRLLHCGDRVNSAVWIDGMGSAASIPAEFSVNDSTP